MNREQESFSHYASKVAVTLCADGVLIVAVTGPLTATALTQIKADVVARCTGGVRSFVVDYRAALIALDGAGLDAVLLGEGPNSAALMPAALVVLPGHLDLFMGHASRMGALGFFRRVFVDRAPALAWAQSIALRQAA